MEECEKKSSIQQKYRIPKKALNTKDAQSDSMYVQSPLSRLPVAYQWENPLQGWTSGPRNRIHPSWKRKRRPEKNCTSDEESAYGYGRRHRRTNDWRQPNNAESSNALLTLRKCDVLLEDYVIKNKEDWIEKRRKDSKSESPNLKETPFQNNESKRRQGDVSYSNPCSSEKSPLSNKEQTSEPIQSPICKNSNTNHGDNPQQENNPQLLEMDCDERVISAGHNTVVSCPRENCSKPSPKKKVHFIISKEKEMPPLVAVARQQKVNVTRPPEEPLNKPRRSQETANPAEPIVLSSDEDEGNVEAEDPEKYFQTGKGPKRKKKEKEQESDLPVSENLSQSVTESKTEQVSEELLTFMSSADEQLGLALDFKFDMFYIGKYKGPATDSVRFTTKYIKIPFEVAHNKKIELTLDSMHLRRFGMWMDNNSAVKRDTFFFLWLSSDYVGQVENKMGLSVLNRQVKNTKYVFIKLSEPLAEEKQAMLDKIIMEISKENPSPDLTEPISWEEVLNKVSYEKDKCFMNFYDELFQKNSVAVLTETSPQVSNASVPKPNYTLLQKQKRGQYSFSVSSTKHSEWKELQEAGPVHNLIIYPPPPAKGGLGVTREDLECLEYGEFLNDVIIDFYLKYLLLEKAPKELADRSHIFSSFFYKCLTRTEKNSEENPNLSLAQRRHRRVKRWTRYINIFNKDYIFVPVNEESHWYIALICFPSLEDVVYEDSPDQCSQQSSLQQFPHQLELRNEIDRTEESALVFKDIENDKEKPAMNSNVQPNGNAQAPAISPGLDSCSSESISAMPIPRKIYKRPCILILDSLKASSAQNTVQVLREYLEAEWEAKRKTFREFSKSTVVDFCPRVPKQDNSSDCGLYLLQYVETFFQSPIVNFELPIHLERWFPRQIVRSKRDEIKDLILQLHLKQQSGSKS
ncbi:hypothetical protein JRQ81_019843 [Phrynocephalus forsythii]|uniref:Ubiquitin-like protease family profile domain-containing protein n=1 Tax=Phrynocephalus forsythii TaxID=171643 RepID=A0A9Q1AYW8_9SAUR|nr:hypothetical protein JRQ81_019843 [Phrynocephalus forsythii]